MMTIYRRSLRGALSALLLLSGAVVLGACGSDSTATDIDVVNPRLVKTQGGQRAFTGTLVNNRPNRISIAQVEVALYDDSGSQIETVRIEVEDIPPQDSVDFSGTIDSDLAFSQAQVKSVLTP